MRAWVGAANAAKVQLTAPPQNQGPVDQLKGWAGSQTAAWKELFEAVKQAAEQATQHVIKLMVIFILQTLVVPLAMLWGLYALARAVLRHSRPRVPESAGLTAS